MDGSKENSVKESPEIHQKALDDLVSANSLFTVAVFVGLAFAKAGQRSLENRPECDADIDLCKRLIVFEVVSFSCFLLSSLVAKTLKVYIIIYKEKKHHLKIYRAGLLFLSAWGSILGCLFLMLSMVDLIQIHLGKLSCGSVYTLGAAGALIGIVSLALLIYIPSMMHAVYLIVKHW